MTNMKNDKTQTLDAPSVSEKQKKTNALARRKFADVLQLRSKSISKGSGAEARTLLIETRALKSKPDPLQAESDELAKQIALAERQPELHEKKRRAFNEADNTAGRVERFATEAIQARSRRDGFAASQDPVSAYREALAMGVDRLVAADTDGWARLEQIGDALNALDYAIETHGGKLEFHRSLVKKVEANETLARTDDKAAQSALAEINRQLAEAEKAAEAEFNA